MSARAGLKSCATQCGKRLAFVLDAAAGLNLNGDIRRGEKFVVPFQPDPHLVRPGAEDMLDGVSAFDFALAGLIRLAVERRLRFGAVSPIPQHRRTVVVLKVVG